MRKLLLSCSILLAGCGQAKLETLDVAGVYQAPAAPCTLQLTLQPGMLYTYERLCGAGAPAFSHSGSWQLGNRNGETAVALRDFKLGLDPAPDAEPGILWLVKVERPWFGLGQPRLCLDLDRNYCLRR